MDPIKNSLNTISLFLLFDFILGVSSFSGHGSPWQAIVFRLAVHKQKNELQVSRTDSNLVVSSYYNRHFIQSWPLIGRSQRSSCFKHIVVWQIWTERFVWFSCCRRGDLDSGAKMCFKHHQWRMINGVKYEYLTQMDHAPALCAVYNPFLNWTRRTFPFISRFCLPHIIFA